MEILDQTTVGYEYPQPSKPKKSLWHRFCKVFVEVCQQWGDTSFKVQQMEVEQYKRENEWKNRIGPL